MSLDTHRGISVKVQAPPGRFARAGPKPDRLPSVQGFPTHGEAVEPITKDARDNKRGCFIIAAVVAVLLAALAWGILSTREDPRSNGIVTPGAAQQAQPSAPDPGKS